MAIWTEHDNHGFENEEDYLASLKKDDNYTLTYQFEYIAKNHGDDNYDIETADMNVRVEWSDVAAGYTIAYDVPEMHKIEALLTHLWVSSGRGELVGGRRE